MELENGLDIHRIERLRNLHTDEIWPECGKCEENFRTGFVFWCREYELGVLGIIRVYVCDDCLNNSKKRKSHDNPTN
jgi:hypothetical protein